LGGTRPPVFIIHSHKLVLCKHDIFTLLSCDHL